MTAPPDRRLEVVTLSVAVAALLGLAAALVTSPVGTSRSAGFPRPIRHAESAGEGTPRPPATAAERETREGGVASVPLPPVVTYPRDGAELATARFRMHGWGEVGAGIELWSDGAMLASSSVSADRRWTAVVSLGPGERTVRVVAVRGGARSREAVVRYRVVPSDGRIDQ